ncbi:MAG TPA: lasso peptide biosynthesis B2 protein [Sphingomicrobium sp.]|nr:lasso peptide biosynthesis B2 protein [Sphingomicrobium sp.]
MIGSAILSVGLVGGRPVFMDERNDSYFLLEEKSEAEFLDLIDCDGPLMDGAGASLRSALGADEDMRVVFAQPPQASRTLLDQPEASRPRIGDALRIALLLRRARTAIATRPIGEILLELARGNRSIERRPGDAEVVRQAARFIAARRLVPGAPNCLADSLALVQWLGRPQGVLLIFGVKLDPFGAHCWAQLGDLLLSDRTDTVAQFRPVRVVECTPATL